MRQLLKQYLTKEGFEIVLAEDGRKAQFIARQESLT